MSIINPSTSDVFSQAHPESRADDDDGPQPCICSRCRTPEYLVPETVTERPPSSGIPARFWDVSYWCSNCDFYYGHTTNELPPTWT